MSRAERRFRLLEAIYSVYGHGAEGASRFASQCRKVNAEIRKAGTRCPLVMANTFQDCYVRQDGQCIICGADFEQRPFVIEHCHATGRFRGLTCNPCNAFIWHYDYPLESRVAPALFERHFNEEYMTRIGEYL
jgi:Recombination endonuclease VII